MLFERLRAALRRHWSAPASPRLHVDLSRFLPWTFSRRSRIEQVAGFAFVFEQAARCAAYCVARHGCLSDYSERF